MKKIAKVKWEIPPKNNVVFVLFYSKKQTNISKRHNKLTCSVRYSVYGLVCRRTKLPRWNKALLKTEAATGGVL